MGLLIWLFWAPITSQQTLTHNRRNLKETHLLISVMINQTINRTKSKTNSSFCRIITMLPDPLSITSRLNIFQRLPSRIRDFSIIWIKAWLTLLHTTQQISFRGPNHLLAILVKCNSQRWQYPQSEDKYSTLQAIRISSIRIKRNYLKSSLHSKIYKSSFLKKRARVLIWQMKTLAKNHNSRYSTSQRSYQTKPIRLKCSRIKIKSWINSY